MDTSNSLVQYFLNENTFLLIGVFVVTAIILYDWTGQKSIPGPRRWPVLGNYPQLARNCNKDSALFFRYIHEEFGPVGRFYFGKYQFVLVSGYKLCHEVFVSRRDVMVCRPDFIPGVKEVLHIGPGVVYGNGIPWTEGRKTLMAAISCLLGSSEYEDQVLLEEVHQLVQEMSAKGAEDFRPKEMLLRASVAWNLGAVAGRRFARDDKMYKDFHDAFVSNVTGDDMWSPFGTVSFLQLIPFINKSYKKTYAALEDEEGMLRSLIQERKAAAESTSFAATDVFIREQRKSPDNTTYSDDNITRCLVDYVKGGTLASAVTVAWALHFLSVRPEVQKRCQTEIDEVCDKTERVTFSCMDRLPYTCAILYEVQRIKTIVTTSLPYWTMSDLTIKGYQIPQGTLLLQHLASVHMDKSQWTEPEKFNPERFLNFDGKLLKKPSAFIPFGNSTRKCPGNSISERDMVVVLANLVQEFNFSSTGVEPVKPEDITIKATPRT